MSTDVLAELIAGREKLLVIAEREKRVTGIVSLAALGVTLWALAVAWPLWAVSAASLGFGSYGARYLRARRFIHSTQRSITRLRGSE